MNTVNVKSPSIGSIVRVITRHRNIYYYTYKQEPYVFRTYEGTVLPNNKWNSIYSFNLTGDENIPVRNIHMDNVNNIEYIAGKSENSKVRIFKVSSKKNTYTVVKNNKNYSCDCVGFKYHKNCRHVKGVIAKIEKE